MKRLGLLVSLILILSAVLSACSTPTPEVVIETVVVEAEPEVIEVEKEVVVTQEVEKEVIVEKEVVELVAVGGSPFPVQFATLEDYAEASGRTIDSFQGAPMLDDMDLPPVEERLPSEPAVVQPLDSIGVYGGELAGPSTQPTCCGWDVLEMRLQKLFTVGPDLQTIIPNIAKGYDVSADQREFTIYLREGHKWSDGAPFTAEDFRFYFEDIISNEEVTPAAPWPFAQGGVLPEFEVVDETTVRYTFANPYPTFILALATEVGNRGFRPAHYFSQFHLDYNETANEVAADQGFDDWIQILNAKLNPYSFTWNLGSETDPYAPTLNTFVFASEDSFGNKIYERNPYFFKVDVAGNQLPYTDSLRRILVEDLEVQDLKGIAGEYSHYGWGKLLNYQVYKENEESGGYRTVLVPYERGNEYSLSFNFNHPDPVMAEIFQDIRFRQAMSLAINRDEINDLVYFGLATPRQASPTPGSAFYANWMGDYYASFDVEQANVLLDEMGLDQRDADGFRLRPDGQTLFINMQVSVPEDAWSKIAELVASYWNAVGVQTSLKMIGDGLYTEIRNAATHDVGAWALDNTDIGEYSGNLYNLRPSWGAKQSGMLWEAWLESNGEEGVEPPDEIKELWDAGEAFLATNYLTEEYVEAGKAFYDLSVKGVYEIGTVGLPPQPLLFDINLMNTPPADTEGVWSWDYRQWVMFMPEQWYFSGE